MITFSNLKTLLSHLECLDVSNTNETGSAINCLKIEQISSKLTKFTTYEPKVGVYERQVYETHTKVIGDSGDVYLVEAKKFIDMVRTFANTNCLFLSIREEEGMLAYYDTYENTDGTNEIKYYSKDYMSLYQGDSADFTPPEITDLTYLGYCPEESFNNLVKIVTSTGQYTDANESYYSTVNSAGRSIMLNTSIDKVQLFASSKNLSVLFRLNLIGSFEKDQELHLEGRHFNRLKSFSLEGEPVEIYLGMYTDSVVESENTEEYYYSWVVIKSKFNYLACRLVDENQSLKSYYDNFTAAQSLNYTGRQVNRYSLANAFTRIKSKGKKGQLSILVLEDLDHLPKPVFILKDADSFLSPAEHKVELDYENPEPFLAIAYTVDQLESILSILKVYVDEAIKTKHPIIEIELGVLKRTFNGQEYPILITYISPFEGRDDLLLMCNPADGLQFIAPSNNITYDKTVEDESSIPEEVPPIPPLA